MKKWLTVINDGKDTILDVRLEDENGVIQIFDGEILIYKHPFEGNQIIVPEGVTRIAAFALSDDDCSKIVSLSISSSVCDIEDMAFASFSNLKSIVVTPNNKVYDSRNDCNAIIETATGILIKGCKNTKIPDGVKEIGTCAFIGCDLTEITFPSSLMGIGVSAFSGSNLTNLYIPYTVKWVGEEAFAYCKNLHSVEIPDTLSLEELIDIEDYERWKYSEFYESPCTIKKYWVYKDGRYNPSIVKWYRKVKTIKIPNGVTTIYDHEYENYTSLESITIPNSVTSIGAAAFRGCKKLKAIKIPYQVTRIAQYAFEGCKELESIELPENTMRIDRQAFAGCKKLKRIELPESLSIISVGAFDFCNSLEEILVKNKDIVFSDLLKKKEDYFFGVDVEKITLVVPEDIDRFRLREYVDAFSPVERRVEYWRYE